MKLPCLLALLMISPMLMADETPAQPSLDMQAKGAIKALGGQLKTELQAAMEQGGPLNAVQVCNDKAAEIATQVSQQSGMQVGRTSLKPRRDDNAAKEWQVAVLNDFEARKAAGEAPASLVYSAEVDGEYRFMKAIPTAKVCTTCHGTEVKPDVLEKISQLYPNDHATGFKEGDLRGAFVVTRQLH